jgi:hypothetical protein
LGGVIVLLASSPGLLLLSTNPHILFRLTGWPLYTLKTQNNKKKGHPEGVSYSCDRPMMMAVVLGPPSVVIWKVEGSLLSQLKTLNLKKGRQPTYNHINQLLGII